MPFSCKFSGLPVRGRCDRPGVDPQRNAAARIVVTAPPCPSGSSASGSWRPSPSCEASRRRPAVRLPRLSPTGTHRAGGASGLECRSTFVETRPSVLAPPASRSTTECGRARWTESPPTTGSGGMSAREKPRRMSTHEASRVLSFHGIVPRRRRGPRAPSSTEYWRAWRAPRCRSHSH